MRLQKREKKRDQSFPGKRKIKKPPIKKEPLDIDELDKIIRKTEEVREEDQKEGE